MKIDHVAETYRPMISVPDIDNGGFDKAKAEAALRAGTADLISFGALFLANPDLPKRFRRDVAMNPTDRAHFLRRSGPKGFTDYPALERVSVLEAQSA